MGSLPSLKILQLQGCAIGDIGMSAFAVAISTNGAMGLLAGEGYGLLSGAMGLLAY